MNPDEIKALDNLFSKAITILELISKSELLIYFVAFVVFLVFVFTFTRLILEFNSASRVDKVIDKNSEMLGEVRNALQAFVLRNN